MMDGTVGAVVAIRNEPELGEFIGKLVRYVDWIVLADESDDVGPGVDLCRQHRTVSAIHTHGGIGPSLVAAWKLVSGRAAHIVQIDAGGSHDPRDIPGMLRAMRESDADVVVGSRFMAASTYTGRRWRQLASQVYSWHLSWETGESVTDWTSGFRVYKASALEYLAGLEYEATMHGFNAEVLVAAVEAGMDVREKAITYRAGRSALTWGGVREAWKVGR